jgi:hypothetical protein
MKKILPIVAILAVVGLGVFFVVGRNTTKVANYQTSTEEKNDKKAEPAAESAMVKLPKQTVGQEADCSLYNLDELSKVWGVTLTQQKASKVINISAEGGKLYTCEYNETNWGKGLNFSIEYKEYPSVEAAKNEMAGIREAAKFDDQATEDQINFENDEQQGVGDEAFFNYSKKATKKVLELLYVRKGNVVMLVSATNLDGVGPDYREKVIKSYKLHFD